MILTGAQYLGNQSSASGNNTFSAFNPQTGEALPVSFHEATPGEIDQAVTLAEQAFVPYSRKSASERADFLDRIAEEIMALGDALIDRCMQETALPQGRLQGERGRTVNQLKLFAKVVREGSWVDARIDRADPERTPVPKPDVRHMLVPLGPVGIFGASNFPLAFSVAGGDTASALAAGCPVVVKGHPAHPGTSELIASAIVRAADASGMPNGVFSMIQGVSHETGGALVRHPLIHAIGFTGSFRGGKALFDIANQRPRPIPVFAEMGSTNPVFILPGAMKARSLEMAAGLSVSMTLGVGQFCTNPGLVFLPESTESASFKEELSNKISASSAGTMLTSGIKNAYEKGAGRLEQDGLVALAAGQKADTQNSVKAQVFTTSISHFASHPELAEEVFGPSTILVEPDGSHSEGEAYREALLKAAHNLEGHLTATVHGTPEDLEAYQDLFQVLERKVGRILINGFPTGVEVCHAMVHGGPFPATTAPQTTSVGTTAIRRFARPVCYQNFPGTLLPSALQDENPGNIWRLVDGNFTQDSL